LAAASPAQRLDGVEHNKARRQTKGPAKAGERPNPIAYNLSVSAGPVTSDPAAPAAASPAAGAPAGAPAGFRARSGVWECDGLPLGAIARAVGTPCYVYSAALIRERYGRLSQALAGSRHAIHYALKANSTLALVRLIQGLGASADCNSVGEIEVALAAGFEPRQIVFTGVGKSGGEIARAVALGLKAINAESRGELERIDAESIRQGRRTRVALRVNPDVDAKTHPNISTGMKRNKFGVPIGDAPAILREMSTRRGLQIVGIHVHVGSQITTLEPLARAAERMIALAAELQAAGIALEHLDLGGGLGISYDGGAEPDVEAYAAVVTAAARETGLSLIVEPGRWLSGNAGALLAEVIDVKPAPDDAAAPGVPARQFVILDAGMTDLMRPALYGAVHRIVRIEPGEGLPVPCDIVGPVCESSDAFLGDRTLVDPQVGTLVAILDAGAYGAAMGSNYNRRPLAPEVLVDGGHWRVIRRPQTLDDMVRLECP
jgi:diaminopimelate decarboxylase